MVPLTMPITRRTGSPRRLSRSGRMSGMPPPTAASKRRSLPGLVGRLEELDADVGEQLLVGGDDRLAVLQRRGDQLACRFDPADHLDDDVDVGVAHDGVRVAGEHRLGDRHVAVAREVAHGDLGDLEPDPGALLDLVGLLADERHQRGADVAAPEYPEPNRPCRHDEGAYENDRPPLPLGSPVTLCPCQIRRHPSATGSTTVWRWSRWTTARPTPSRRPPCRHCTRRWIAPRPTAPTHC